MILAGYAALLLLGLGGSEAKQMRARAPAGPAISVRQQIIIRVPVVRGRVSTGAPPREWREGRGPRCIPANRIIGAAALGQNSIDLVFRDNSRMRAQLQRRCPALSYYRGFYVNATEDGQICADRDVVRSRTGGECQIDRFRTLRPARP